jgi:hypothetical protein
MSSSSGFSPILGIELPATRRPAVLVLVATGLALMAVVMARLPGPLAGAAGAVVLGGGLAAAWRVRPRARGSVRQLELAADGRLRAVIVGGAGPPDTDVRLAGTWRLAWFAVGMRLLAPSRRPVTVLLFRDQVPPADWRRLAVHLRLARVGDRRPAPGEFT